MSPDDRYDDFDELLRSALRDEADTVTPAGDGLARIQQRLQQRDTRLRWMRPALALGSAAALAVIGVGAAIFVNNSGDDSVKVGQHPSPLNSTSAASTEPITVEPTFPPQAIFPFTDATSEQGWEQDYANGGTTWEADPTQVATHWVQDFLDEQSVDRVVGTADDGPDKLVTLGRLLQAESHQLIKVTTVRLTPFGHAWIVTGASDPNGFLSITSPDPGSTVITPVTVTGPAFGVEEAVKFDIRDATSTTSYGSNTVTFGNGHPDWNVSVNFNRPSSPVGVLVGTDTSLADGGPNRIVAEQVQFSPAAPNQPPPYFYAVKNNRITEFASRTGSPIKYLTAEQPGGGLTDPQVYGGDVYYLQGAGTCANGLMKVSTSADGSANGESVAAPDNGYIITSYAVASGGVVVTTFETACDPARSPQARLVTRGDGGGNTIDFASLPPAIIGDPSWEPIHGASGSAGLIAFVRTGNQGYLARYLSSETSPTPSNRACPGLGPEDGQPQAIEDDSNGALWVALQTGSSMDVVRCFGNKAKTAFTVPGNDQPADIDVTSDGSAVLLTDQNGKVWRWDGSGNPQQLSTTIPLTQVSW